MVYKTPYNASGWQQMRPRGRHIRESSMKFTLNDLIAVPRRRKPDRRQFIGGSDARIIMSPDDAALIRLWKEKRGEVEPEDFSDNLVVQLGVATEALNQTWYERNTGRVVTDVQRWVRHPVHRYLAATLDGFVNDLDAVFEAKFMLPWSFSEEAAAEKHMAQLQHNMWVSNARSAVLSIITGGGKWIDMTIPADALYQHFLITAERRFWRCVQTGEMPSPYGIEPPRPRIEAVRVVDMRASMDQPKGTPALASWFRALCARYSMSKRSSRTRCATTWNAATPSSKPRWRKFCASTARSRSLKRPRPHRRRRRATRWRSSPMTRNPASRRSPRPPRICRPSPAPTRPSRAIMNISATARSACWPASTSSPARFTLSSRIATAAANSSNPQASRRRLSSPHGDQADPRQSFRAHLQGNQGLARRAARRPLRIHLHAQARLLAQSRRGLLFQACPLRPAPHPSRIETGTQGAHHRRHGRVQSISCHPYLVL